MRKHAFATLVLDQTGLLDANRAMNIELSQKEMTALSGSTLLLNPVSSTKSWLIGFV